MKLTHALAAASLLAGTAAHAHDCGSRSTQQASYDQKAQKTIVETAMAAGQFETLVAAVKAAGLVDTLQGPGPFTVFAPTDAAFAALPAGTVEGLLANPVELRRVLTYHVAAGQMPASKVLASSSIETVLGQSLAVNARSAMVGNANVVKTDIMASNGVIHVIDRVLIPEAPQPNIVEVAMANGNFETLVAAIKAAGLVETLSGEGPFTVFAPTDAAFARLPKGTVEGLLQNPAKLREVLTYHVVSGKVTSDQVVNLRRAETVQGAALKIRTNKGVRVGNANVVATDVMASNGVIHVIDTVLMPPASGRVGF